MPIKTKTNLLDDKITMASTEERFQAAVNVIKGLPKNGPYQPSNSMMLKFYGLYKQATEGPCTQRKPSFWDVVNKAKWEAWSRNGHLTKKEAMQKYVANLQEIIETMSFTENVQNFVGSLQGLENINLDDLDIIAPGIKELAESHPNSPFHSRTNSPQRSTNDHEETLNFNGHGSFLDNVTTLPPTPVQNMETTSQLLNVGKSIIDYSQTNGLSQSDESDDEYADPFDIQNELVETLQRNSEIVKQVQVAVVRMNSDISSIHQRMLDVERNLRELKNAVSKQRALEQFPVSKKYPVWWPFSDISPFWFVLLVLWPFVARKLGRLFPHSKQK